jgi:TRAP-type C4-dicarboxylate transport system permease small subunit
MYEKYANLEKIIYKVEKTIVVLAFAIIFVTVALQVVQRFFNLPIRDTSEISLVCQAVFTFFCVSMLVYTGGHITIEVQKLIKNKNILRIVDTLTYVFLLAFAGIFIWLGYDLLLFAVKSGTATTALRVPLWIPYGSLFVGLIFLVLHTIGAIWKMFIPTNEVGAADYDAVSENGEAI